MPLARRLAALIVMMLIVGGMTHAQRQAQSVPERPAQPAVQSAPAPPMLQERDATETREQLAQLLAKYPPSLGRVLKADPTLLGNPEYLAPYPALANFLLLHPEVAHNPGYFLARVPGGDGADRPLDARGEVMALWRSMLDGVAVFSIILTVTLSLVWLIKTLLDWRRWSRLARVQAEVHVKLLDRFTANEDLLAYIQTPAGRRFLESGPVLTEAGPRPLGAPVSRILWSFQVGIVLFVGGLGLVYVSGRVLPDVGQGLSVMGVLAIALGLGFALSGLAAWLISRRMGLFDSLVAPPADRNATV